jgi:predicted ATPase/class 3 adenylate cyclase
MRRLPTGTVTFLFTDVEGSTRLLQEHGERYGDVLAEHRRAVRGSVANHGGVEVDTQGDAFFFAFAGASDAVAAAEEAQAALADGPVQVRMGIHTGEPQLTDEGYVGIDVHKAARICAAAHGEQVVLSERTRSLLDGPFSLTDLGLHRLKDLGEPEKLVQLGERAFPPLRSLNATNLPVQASALVGRERELAEAQTLVRAHRLVTVTGPGGSGKTRLALQVAAELTDEFEDGVFWVSLAALTDPELVLTTIAATLGAKRSLAEHIDERRMLLLLDNLEHLLDCTPALGRLLASCPNLTLLVTSRAILRLTGEREYEVPPLPDEDALALFRERAVQAEPDRAVEEICRRLDGLPLAIELAAARTRALPPDKLLERLARRLPLLSGGPRDAPERQKTLEATIEWSYDLLSREDGDLFARLAVFPGSFDLEAAEGICAADLDMVESLLGQSLLRRTAKGRFFFLDTIREFALEKLEQSGEGQELRRRHAAHFLRLVEEAALHLDQPLEQRHWLERLDEEIDNLRTALAWSAAGDDPDLGLRLAASLREFWFVRGHYSEGLRWLESMLARGVAGTPRARLRAFGAASALAMKLDEVAVAGRYADEALTHARDLGDTLATARMLQVLSNVARLTGDERRQNALLSEGFALAREAGDVVLSARFLAGSGMHFFEAGDFERARVRFAESLALSEEAQSEQGIARGLGLLGALALADGRVEDAVELTRRSLEIAHRLGWMEGIAYQLVGLACAYAELGQAELAAKLLGTESRLADESHLRLERYYLEFRRRAHAKARRKVDVERRDRLLAEGRAMPLDDAVQHALSGDD